MSMTGLDGVTNQRDYNRRLADHQKRVIDHLNAQILAMQEDIFTITAALIAAEELAKALEVAYSFIFDEYYQPNRDDGECLSEEARGPVDKITSALAAYRAVTGDDS